VRKPSPMALVKIATPTILSLAARGDVATLRLLGGDLFITAPR